MKSERIATISSFIEKDDNVIDVGCDHGYLSILLKSNNLCNRVLASDVSKNALSYAINNIEKANLEIPTQVSNGIEDIDVSLYDTLVIAGMGTETIIKILSTNKLRNINKIIIQTNNEQHKMRKFMNEINFHLDDEKIVCENEKYYEIQKFINSTKKNSNIELEFGMLKKEYHEYYNYLVKKFEKVLEQIPKDYKEEQRKFEDKIKVLKEFINN